MNTIASWSIAPNMLHINFHCFILLFLWLSPTHTHKLSENKIFMFFPTLLLLFYPCSVYLANMIWNAIYCTRKQTQWITGELTTLFYNENQKMRWCSCKFVFCQTKSTHSSIYSSAENVIVPCGWFCYHMVMYRNFAQEIIPSLIYFYSCWDSHFSKLCTDMKYGELSEAAWVQKSF